ncbi:MAG TPA: methyltransferase [Anaeromyxobacteraceae bacterium]|nr:methyltransferase [Anaeromyxobacteraceae bacterium]
MHPFRYHVFVCDQRKPEGAPSCQARGSESVVEALRREVVAHDLAGLVAVTPCGSLGLCENGPNLVVYPEGVWYSHVSAADVPEIVSEHFQRGRPVERLARRDEEALRREMAQNREKALAARRAREGAGAVPDDLADTLRGYMPSRVLLTALELDVFTAVARCEEPAAPALAAAMGCDPRATRVLLDGLVALGALKKDGDRYANAEATARFLVAGSPDDARAALRHNLSLWSTWSTLTQVVRTGRPVRHQEMQERGSDWTTPFIAAMHRNAALRAPLVVQAVGACGARRLLDVGGGSGAYAIAFARAVPGLEAEVFDLPTVVPIAQRHIAEAGLSERVRTRVGDLRRDAFGTGYDLVLLSAICHMLGPDENRDLFRRIGSALAQGGRLVIQDHLMAEDRTAPRAGALFAINMLVGTPGGGTYTEGEYAAWLAEAGFSSPRRIALPGPNDLLVAARPGPLPAGAPA